MNKRLALFPIKDQEIWDLYKKHQSLHWTAEEINFTQDKIDYETLNEKEKGFIQHILAFFAVSDTLVNNNIAENFLNHPENNLEINCFYGFQTMIENIHSETYSMQVENIIDDPKTRRKLFNAIENFPSIREKAEWIQRWTSQHTTYAERLLAFVIIEGIFFSASFCSIYFFKQRGLMPGLTMSNEYIARDEGLHTDFGITLFKRKNKSVPISKVRIEQIVREAVEIEKNFAKQSLKSDIIGMNSDLLSNYIEFIADTVLINVGYSKIYFTENSFDFMEQIGMSSKANFFEQGVTNYQKSGVLFDNKIDWEELTLKE